MATLLARLQSHGLFQTARRRAMVVEPAAGPRSMAVETVPGYNRLMALNDAALAELGLRRSDIEAWGAGRILCIRPFTEQVRRIIEESIDAERESSAGHLPQSGPRLHQAV